MSERKPCIRCQRAIDRWAGICPFCNWNQAEPLPAAGAIPRVSAVQYKPPEEMDVKKMIAIGAGALISLVLAFLIGMVINRDGAPKRAPESLEEQAAEHNVENLKPKRADTPLVPAGEGGIDNEPITSAPVPAAPGQPLDEYQRTDATAVSADEYAQMAKRAQAEKKKKMAVLVDPRSINGVAYAGGSPAPPRPRPALPAAQPGTQPGAQSQQSADTRPPVMARRAERTVRTRPVPQYQPVPRVGGVGKARFTLMVGTDGRVKDVNVEHLLPGGNNAALLGAIQTWRFKPATENGEPVAAPYSVEISFNRE
jgi:RNA polymerase subunit RPABC4/transcription elongation factor Spt4